MSDDREQLQHQAKPFGPPPDAATAKMFNLAPCDVDGYLPPLETIAERASRDPRGLGGEKLRLFWREKFAHDLTLADLYPYRLKAAWRIVREWAILIGIVESPSETLRTACNVQPSPWTNRKLKFGSRTPPDTRVQQLILDAEGLPFLPPAPPTSAEGRADYTPARDHKLKKWCALVHHIGATRLAMGTSMQGRYGIAGLADPNLARLAMPVPAEICGLEELLVRQALDELVAHNRQVAAEMLRSKHKLFDHEIDQVIAMAQARAASTATTHPAAVKGLLMLRLEKILDECNERFDARGALLTLREMGKVAGIDAQEEAGTVEDMANTARLTSGKRPEKKLPPPPSI